MDQPRLALVKLRLVDLLRPAEQRRASMVWLVGSVATGNERASTPERKGSDIDFYVPKFDVPDDKIYDAHVGLQLDYQQILAGYEVQVHRYGGEGIWSLRPDYEAQMRAEAIDLHTLR